VNTTSKQLIMQKTMWTNTRARIAPDSHYVAAKNLE